MKNNHEANVLIVCIIAIPFAIAINWLLWTDQYGSVKDNIIITCLWIIFIGALILGAK